MKIVTRFDVTNPRAYQWSAVDDDTYDGRGSIMGVGATEEEAIADFKEQTEDRGRK